ncbi:methionine adenosyltransferase [Natronomonas sp. F2-12]|jgi:S-adenosylmethionine synthetase|uniref:S-adenosylmethionine synthase n=1 Tax=Natronomonas aquatica TaxID=2841590 RepID=A0A9R1D5M7_9EURY|nr:methionine adenosyltransferase [Natronomonas aquatica]MCQ4333266.1 methionine adenosyltransferase [Natronomonas aquatica]
MTDRNIRVEPVVGRAVEAQDVEIVERKGLGHPDSLCDGIAEHVSQALAREYIDRVGKVLHYNTDETQLVAGSAAPAFGGGEVIDPIYLLITGRATKEYGGTRIPAETIALRAAREYITENFPFIDFGTDVVVDVRLGEGSGDLQEVFGEDGKQVPMSNDTSFGVGHAPLTETETIVLETERQLNGRYSDENPGVGQDIKVMGKREGEAIDVTVAAAIVDRYVADIDEYEETIAGIRTFVEDLAATYTDRDVTVHVNTADNYEDGSIYLTTTGTSAEQGDDGSVGRGNRANGLITPNRSMSMEATSGKNPVNHIGKIYNLLSTEIAHAVVGEVAGIEEIRIRLLSQIGQPIDRPHVADATLVTEDGIEVDDIEAEIRAIVDRELENVTDITQRVIDGELTTF